MNNSKSKIELLVGLFALAGFVIIVFMSTTVNRLRVAQKGSVEYEALFDTVSGLEEKTPVELAGVNVGYVADILLENNKAKLKVKIKPKVKLYKNAVLRIGDRGILGDKILVLEAGDAAAGVLPPGQRIEQTIGHSEFDRLVSTMADASGDIKEITSMVKSFVSTEKDEENLHSMLNNFREVSESLKRTTEAVEELTLDNRGKIGDLVEDLRQIAVTVREAVENKDTGVKQSLAKVNEAMESLASVMKKVDSGEGTIGRLVHDETTVENVNEAVEGLNEVLGSMRRIQTSFMYRGEYLFDSGSMQNLVGIQINTRPDKFFLIEIVDAPRGETNVTETIVSSPPGNVVATTQSVRTNDKILFSVMFGKRFYDLTFRFGLIRNKGGLALDYHFLNDIFKISLETFDFGRFENRPHMRAYGTIQLYKNFLITGGADDVMNRSGQPDWFVGAGVFFTDNDFKSLFSAVSVP